jgi:hypothetical protein
MDETLFITALFNLEIEDEYDVDIEVMPGVNITNDSHIVKNCITNSLATGIGQLEVETLLNAKAVIYGVVPTASYSHLNQQQLLYANLIFVESFLQTTWLIKDNSINYELGFLETPYNKRNSTISSNFLASLHTMASGEIKACKFTVQEIVEAIELQDRVYAFKSEELRNLKNFLQKGNSRLARVFHFLEVARFEGNPVFKIAHYCTCFETLFSTSSTELSHKLSERIASFIDCPIEKKFDVYQEIKSAYNVRSKVVHGDNLSNNQVDSLSLISENCDKYLRTILRKVLDSDDLKRVFEFKNDALEDYFVKLALGIDVMSGRKT